MRSTSANRLAICKRVHESAESGRAPRPALPETTELAQLRADVTVIREMLFEQCQRGFLMRVAV